MYVQIKTVVLQQYDSHYDMNDFPSNVNYDGIVFSEMGPRGPFLKMARSIL